MGWTYYTAIHFGKNGKIDKKAEMIAEAERYGEKVLRASMNGNEFYGAVQRKDGSVYGLVCLTATRGCEFGYKDMTEDMLPFYYHCPKSIIDLLSPTDNENALKWRATCLERNAKKRLGSLPEGTKLRVLFNVDTSVFSKGDEITAYKTAMSESQYIVWNGDEPTVKTRKKYAWITYTMRGTYRIPESLIKNHTEWEVME